VNDRESGDNEKKGKRRVESEDCSSLEAGRRRAGCSHGPFVVLHVR